MVSMVDKRSLKQPMGLSVDVEDYFHVAAFSKVIPPEEWGVRYPARVLENTSRLLAMFEKCDARSTFFVLGWVADRYPQLVKDIHAAGHEVGCHGYWHKLVGSESPAKFCEDVSRAKNLLEELTGEQVAGFRAPSFSINSDTEWAYEILASLGFSYSSSTYPVYHDIYGCPGWPRFRFMRPEGIMEIPMPTISLGRHNFPVSGGGYFRLYPYSLTKRLINAFTEQTGQPFNFYCHPWELDPGQPRIRGASVKSRFRHYLNLDKTEIRMEMLLHDYKWRTLAEVYGIGELQMHSKVKIDGLFRDQPVS